MPLTHGFSRSTVYVLLVVFVALLGGIGLSIYHTNRVAAESNRRWCGVLRVYHDAYANNPEPPTQLGRDIKAQLEDLYADFHCDTVSKP